MNRRHWLVSLGLALVISLAGVAGAHAANSKAPAPAAGAAQAGTLPIVIVGKPSPPLAGIQWADGSGPSTAVKGKTTIVMTYVTWCPICNQWAPEMLKQVSESIEDKPVILVAVCTDKGAQEGKAFLQQKGLEGPNIFYGAASTMNETFAMDPKNLWNFAYIGADGTVKKTSAAGSYYNNTDPKKYVMAMDLEQDKKLGTLDFIEPGMSADVKGLLWPLELGDLTVLQKISQPKNLRGLSKEDQASLKDVSTKFLDTHLETIKSLADGEMPSKIEAYEKATAFSTAFKTTAQGKEATKIANTLNGLPNFKKEMAAKKLYLTTTAKIGSNDALKTKLMGNVAKAYPETYYGDLAKSIADGTQKVDDAKTDDGSGDKAGDGAVSKMKTSDAPPKDSKDAASADTPAKPEAKPAAKAGKVATKTAAS